MGWMLAVDFEELAYPYIIIGRDLTVKLVNKPFASLFGESVEDLMNKRIDKLQLSANLAGRFVTKFPILVNMAEEMYDKEDPSKAIIPFKSMPFSTAIADGKEFEGLINCKADFDEKGRLVSLLLWGIPSYLICVHSLEGEDKLSGFYDQAKDIFYLGQSYGLKYLTSKEFKVFAQVLLYGDSDEEIAKRLSVSRSTCRVHLRSICAKTDCKSRGELVSKAMECGWYSMVKSLEKINAK
jgi:DNA-binding CsgD family transcriptional regulator